MPGPFVLEWVSPDPASIDLDAPPPPMPPAPPTPPQGRYLRESYIPPWLPAPYLALPEQPAEHIRNALSLIEAVRDGLTEDEPGTLDAAMERLKKAAAQLEGRVA